MGHYPWRYFKDVNTWGHGLSDGLGIDGLVTKLDNPKGLFQPKLSNYYINLKIPYLSISCWKSSFNPLPLCPINKNKKITHSGIFFSEKLLHLFFVCHYFGNGLSLFGLDVQTPTESWKILWQVEKYFIKNKQALATSRKKKQTQIFLLRFSKQHLKSKKKKISVPF